MELMKGGCEDHVDQGPDNEDKEERARIHFYQSRHFYFRLVPTLMAYAMAHGFEGCEDNKYARKAWNRLTQVALDVCKYLSLAT